MSVGDFKIKCSADILPTLIKNNTNLLKIKSLVLYQNYKKYFDSNMKLLNNFGMNPWGSRTNLYIFF